MKTVFQTSELVHIWAKQKQTEGRNSNRSVFFRDSQIFSYGSHFCMADIIQKPDTNGENGIVIICNRSYSTTTVSHLSAVRYAVNHMERIFVPHPEDIQKSIRAFSSLICDQINTLENPRKKPQTKEQARNTLRGLVQTIDRYFEVKKYNIKKAWRHDDITRKYFLAFYNVAKNEQGSAELVEALKKANAAEKVKETRKQITDLAEWLGVSYSEAKSAAYPDGVYLRLREPREADNELMIESNRGARVSLKAGKLLFDLIEAGKDIKGHDIDGYTVISLNGVLTIGCHKIARTEINRFAKLMNWI